MIIEFILMGLEMRPDEPIVRALGVYWVNVNRMGIALIQVKIQLQGVFPSFGSAILAFFVFIAAATNRDSGIFKHIIESGCTWSTAIIGYPHQAIPLFPYFFPK